MRTRHCRVPTQNNIVGTRHCRVLYHSGAAGIDMILQAISIAQISRCLSVFFHQTRRPHHLYVFHVFVHPVAEFV